MAEITKGNWYVGNIFPLPTIKVDGKRIATISKDLPIEEREANANLIAAAPKLRDFAIEMIKRYPNSPWIYEHANSALANVL